MALRIDLNADWRLIDTEHPVEVEAALEPGRWAKALACRLPSEVHDEYQRAGLIRDPYYGLQFRECYWMESREFWYRRTFEVPSELEGEVLVLHFEGLDTLAEIYLNGRKLGFARDMFVPWEFDITREVNHGTENELVVRFLPPLEWVKETGRHTEGLQGFGGAERNWLRKSPMSFGWDNVPRVLTAGIFRPAWIECYRGVKIEDVHVTTRVPSLDQAFVQVEVELFNPQSRPIEGELRCNLSRQGVVGQANLPFAIEAGASTLMRTEWRLDNPALWWPHTLGEPALYDLAISASAEGRPMDERKLRVGVREIRVIEAPQEDGGTSFVFAINGKRHFVKGFDWQPLEALDSRLDYNDYAYALEHVVQLGGNMLRVWGGGRREQDAFYDLCDEKGIMIWQDFFFACGLYPQDDADFMALVEREERTLFKLLRNHPSLALWCGDNEIDMSYWPQFGEDTPAHNLISHKLTARLHAELDPDRYYLPSSPMSRNNESPYSRSSGNIHNWDCWHGKKSHRSFAEETGRFLTEFGRYALPSRELVERFIPPEARWPVDNETWRFHGGDLENAAIDFYPKLQALLAEFGEPQNLDELIHLSQVSQATFLEFALEHFRRRKYLCGGYLYWKLADTWPCVCNAILQYDRGVKAGYYAVKRAQQPIICSFKDEGESLAAWVVSDLQEPFEGELHLEHFTFDGTSLARRAKRVELAPDEAKEMLRYRPERPLGPSEGVVIRLFAASGELVAERFHFGVLYKELKRPPAQVIFEAELTSAEPQTVSVTVSSDNYAHWIELHPLEPRVEWEDNYFDLAPHSQRRIKGVFRQRAVDPLGELAVTWDNRESSTE